MFIDVPFYPGYYGLSASKKKKIYCGEKKSGSRWFILFNFRHIFGLLNVIIWTFSSAGKLFKIKFSSQVTMNHAFSWTN